MNRDEVSQAILLLDAAYGPKMKAAERDMGLVIEVWMIALEDVPWTPYGESALSWWLKNEAWPPAPAEIRERALTERKQERDAEKNRELIALYDSKPRYEKTYDTSLPGLISEWNRRRKAGMAEADGAGRSGGEEGRV